MATCYATTCDIADFLRISITACTSPSIAQVEKLIKRAEEKIDRRTGHTFGRTKQTRNEVYDLPLLYTFGWGTFIPLKHRDVNTCACGGMKFCPGAGDKLEVWSGGTGSYSDITCGAQTYEVEGIKGEVYLRGFIFSILRKNRIRITYRYGNVAEGVPEDIEDATVKLTCIDLIRSSIKMDDLEFGGAIKKEEAMNNWKEEADKIIRDREEVYVLP